MVLQNNPSAIIIPHTGDVAERLNARDSKSCIRQPRIKGSNPFVSARIKIRCAPNGAYFYFNTCGRRDTPECQGHAWRIREYTIRKILKNRPGEIFLIFIIVYRGQEFVSARIKIRCAPNGACFLNFEIVIFYRFDDGVDQFVLVCGCF